MVSRPRSLLATCAAAALLLGPACGRELSLPALPGSGPAPLAVTPLAVSAAPGSTMLFTASGGLPPITFACQGCAINEGGSDGTVDATGLYTAGPRGEVVDLVRATDSSGASVLATVSVLTPLTVVPSRADSPPAGRLDFLVVGGKPPHLVGFGGRGARSGPAASVAQDAENPSLLHYTAGADGGVEDVISVTDATGTAREVTVSVSRALTVDPPRLFLERGAESVLVAAGGAPPYTFRLDPTAALAGSTVREESGRLVAGARSPGSDRILVTDRLGVSGETTVHVFDGYRPLPRNVQAILPTDLDRDGALDLVVTTPLTTVRLLFGDGAGGISREQALPLPGALASLSAAGLLDVAGGVADGIPDLLVSTGSSGLRLYRGLTAAPWFEPDGAGLPLTGAEGSIAIGELSADGLADAAVALDDRLTLVDFEPGGTARELASLVFAGELVTAVVFADLAGTGARHDLDCVFTLSGYRFSTGRTTELVQAQGYQAVIVAACQDYAVIGDMSRDSNVDCLGGADDCTVDALAVDLAGGEPLRFGDGNFRGDLECSGNLLTWVERPGAETACYVEGEPGCAQLVHELDLSTGVDRVLTTEALPRMLPHRSGNALAFLEPTAACIGASGLDRFCPIPAYAVLLH